MERAKKRTSGEGAKGVWEEGGEKEAKRISSFVTCISARAAAAAVHIDVYLHMRACISAVCAHWRCSGGRPRIE